MARAIRSVTIERGRDPRDFTLVAFGGSGPGACLRRGARALDIRRVLVPVSPGVFTAVGMLASDVEHHFVRAAGGLLDAAAARRAAMRGSTSWRMDARAALARREGYAGDARAARSARRTSATPARRPSSSIPIPGGRLDAERLAALREAFQREYAATYGYASEDEALELVNVRVIATGLARAPPGLPRGAGRDGRDAAVAPAACAFDTQGRPGRHAGRGRARPSPPAAHRRGPLDRGELRLDRGRFLPDAVVSAGRASTTSTITRP